MELVTPFHAMNEIFRLETWPCFLLVMKFLLPFLVIQPVFE
jgi:hypothetical protein